jgi:hypothetical protein
MFPPLVPAASPTSRRGVLMGLAAAATVPAAALATAIGSLPTSLDADAELLALTVSFDPLFEAWRNMFVQQEEDLQEFNERLQRETGMSRAEANRLTSGSPELAAYCQILHECAGDREFKHYDREAWEPISDRFYAVAEEILSYRASTREGLALQVRAFISSYSEIWEDDHGARAFVECVCAFAGVPFPPIPEEAQSPAATVRRIEPPKPDPIYAAIERHRQARSKLSNVVAAADLAFDDPQYDEMQKPLDKAFRKENALTWKLVEIEPTTAAGLRTLMQYVVEIEPRLQWPPGWGREFHKACLRSTEALIDGARA